MEKIERAHVVVLPYSVQGHINPMLQFAKLLAFKGLKVTLITTVSNDKSVDLKTGPVSIECVAENLYPGDYIGADGVQSFRERFQTVVSQDLTVFIAKHKTDGDPIRCLIYDSFIPWALDIAKQHGLTGVSFFTQSCAAEAIYYHVYQGNLIQPLDAPTISVPGLPQFGIAELPTFVSAPDSYPGFLQSILKQFSNLDEVDLVLANTFDKLEDKVVHRMEGLWPMKTIGPTIPCKYLGKLVEGDDSYGLDLWNPNADTCLKWLDRKPIGSVIYVSSGSLAALDVEQMEELAWGLRRTGNYFLWVVRASEKEKLPSNFVEETNEKGLVVPWCPQLEVLAHQAVGCFVTHCGWNSTMEALSLGVPMIAMPRWSDQPTNAKYVEEVWGVGLRVRVDEKGVMRREEVELCIREIVEGERGKEIKKNADRWKELGKEAMDVGGSSNKNIEDFVASLVTENI